MADVVPESYYTRQQEGIRLATEGPFVSEEELLGGKEGLTRREMLCLRLGVAVGQGEWLVVRERLEELDGLCSVAELWRLFAEVVLIRGEIGRRNLVPLLKELHPGEDWEGKDPGELIDLARQVEGISLTDRCNGQKGLTERELALLGIGISFGARCWYT
ncbi:MAG: hypothetical protein IMW94_07675 [Thermoanaerobacter sp.]|nr:hypothetical protein [Thermoanaerobacter sp.]